jgi:hypothetical protein
VRGDPAEDLGEFSVLSRPKQQVPVIRRQTVGGDADLGLGVGFGENLLKDGAVSGLLKERQPSHATVQYVIGEVSRSKAWAVRHADFPPKTRRSRQEKDSRPIFFSLFFRMSLFSPLVSIYRILRRMLF